MLANEQLEARTLLAAITGGAGPGGVLLANGTDALDAWFRADAGVSTDGSGVTTWEDQSGNNDHMGRASASTAGPALVTSAGMNNQPVLRFAKGGANDNLVFGGVTHPNNADFSVISVVQPAASVANSTTTQAGFFLGSGNDSAASTAVKIGLWNGPTFFARYVNGASQGSGVWPVGTTPLPAQSIYMERLTSNVANYAFNGAPLAQSHDAAQGAGSVLLNRVGSPRDTLSQDWPGDIAEMMFYNRPLNATELTIVSNYIASKYNLPLEAGVLDIYAGDTPANGNYDFDLIGIGQLGGVAHDNAGNAGFGVRAVAGLDDNEFVAAAHNGAANSVVPFGGEFRWSRAWYVDKTGNLDVEMSFDWTDSGLLAPPGVPNYSLLYSTDGVNFTNVGLAPVVAGDTVTFNVADTNLNGGYYTLGVANVILTGPPFNLMIVGAPQPASEGATFTINGSFEDFDGADTHTVTIDWGDGNVITYPAIPVGDRTFSYDHTYEQNLNIGILENFESYADGQSLHTASGGFNWNNNWANGNINSSTNHVTVAAKSLVDPNGLVDGGDFSGLVQPVTNIGDAANLFDRTFGPLTADEVYVSMLIRLEGNIEDNDFAQFYISDATSITAGTPSFGVRNQAGKPFFVRMGTNVADTTNSATAFATSNTTFLLVAKISKISGTYQRIDLFVNPTSTTEPALADATQVGTPNAGGTPSITSLSRFRLRLNSWEANDLLFFDELRIGTSFEEVTGGDSPYHVTVTVDDGGDSVSGQIRNVNVLNVAPVVTATASVPTPVDEGAVFTLQGSFADPGVLDAHTVTVDWGDGVVETFPPLPLGDRTFSFTHVYDDNLAGAAPTSDDFDSYAPGDLDGANDGDGWTGAWVAPAGQVTIAAGGLVDPTGQVDGGDNRARIQTTAAVADNTNFLSRTFDPLSDTVYVGMLLRQTGFDASDFLQFYFNDGGTDINNSLSFGLRNVAGNPLYIRSGGFANNVDANNSVSGQTFLVVAKFSKVGATYGRADLFVNPTTAVEPPIPIATSFGALPLTQLSEMKLRLVSIETTDVIDFDSLRIGESFSEVLGFPRSYPIVVTVDDGDGGVSSVTTGALVVNVAPTATFDNSGPADEGGTATVEFTAPVDGPADTAAGFRYAYDFGNTGVFDVGGDDYATSDPSATADVPAALLADGPATIVVRGRIYDQDNAFTEYFTTVVVNNVAPTATFAVDNPVVDEPGAATVSFTGASDPSAVDTAAGFRFAYDFDNDGVFDIGGDDYATSVASTSEAVPAALLADGPAVVTVRARIYDQDDGFTEYTVDITVNNIAPTATVANDGPVDEGSTATVSFSNQFDPSAADTAAGFRYAYDFDNDGVFDVGGDDYASSVAADSAIVPAAFLADGDSVRTVRVRIYDQDDGFTEYTTDIVVNNVAPTAVLTNSGPVGEAVPASVNFSGQFDPSPIDTAAGFRYAYDFGNTGVFDIGGDDYASSSLNPTVLAPAIDDGPATLVVRARIYDQDDGFTEYFTTIVVNNTPPAVTLAGASSAVPGLIYTLDVTVVDPSSADQAAGFMYEIDWNGDNVYDDVFVGPLSGNESFTHSFVNLGLNTVQVRVTDKDGGQTVATLPVNVVPVAMIGDDIYAGGTPMGDRIVFYPSFTPDTVLVRFNADVYGPFHTNPNTRLLAFGNAGNDQITVAGALPYPAVFDGGGGNDYLGGAGADDTLTGGDGNDVILGGEGNNTMFGGAGNDRIEGRAGDDLIFGGDGNDTLNGREGNDTIYGGPGNDHISGGAGDDVLFGEDGDDVISGDWGNDIIVGGAGDDRLFGRQGADVLIGGEGLDRLTGDEDEDILIGGRTDHDDDLDALLSILAEWTSGQALSLRIQNLTQGGGLNGTNVLTHGGTVHDDLFADDLAGGSGADWLFFFTVDRLRNITVDDVIQIN